MPQTNADIPTESGQTVSGENSQVIVNTLDNTGWYMTALFLFMGICVLIFSIIYGKSFEEVERNTIVAFMGAGTIIYTLMNARSKHKLLYDNEKHLLRFVISFCICTILACVLVMIPSSMWPYMAVFVVLLFLSNALTGLVTGSVLLMISELLNKSSSSRDFFMYFLAGVVAIVLFESVDEYFRVDLPIFVSTVMLFVLHCSFEILFDAGDFSIAFFFDSFINIMITLIILFVVLNLTGKYIVNSGYDRYMEINDPGFALMMEMKNTNQIEFFRAIHTAYLTDKITKEMKLNSFKCKTCSYYHRLKLIEGNNQDSVRRIYWKYKFPQDAIELIEEYNMIEKKGIRSREATVVYMSESVIISIMHICQKDKDIKLDYDDLIDKIFRKRIDSGILDHCEFSMEDLYHMKKIMKKEKLYYDFMR